MIRLSLTPAYPVSLDLTSATGKTRLNSAPSVTLALAALVGSGQPPSAGITFNQVSPIDEWVINHNLGFRPSVEVLSVGGAEIEADVVHVTLNQTRIYFVAPTAGSARLT